MVPTVDAMYSIIMFKSFGDYDLLIIPAINLLASNVPHVSLPSLAPLTVSDLHDIDHQARVLSWPVGNKKRPGPGEAQARARPGAGLLLIIRDPAMLREYSYLSDPID